MPLVPSEFSKRYNPAQNIKTLWMPFLESQGSAVPIQLVNSQVLNGIAVGSSIAIAQQWFRDPGARCLTVSMVKGTGVGGYSVRLTGHNAWGAVITEDVAFGSQAASTTYHMFTRNAFLDLTSVVLTAAVGTAGTDRLDIGVTCIVGDIAGTVVLTNGANALQYKGVGLPMPVGSVGTTPAGAADTTFTSEIRIVTFSDAMILTKPASFVVDAAYSVIIDTASTFVPLTGSGVRGIYLYVQSNAGE